MEPIKKESSRAAEIQKLRRELLRRIIAIEARRQAARDTTTMRSDRA